MAQWQKAEARLREALTEFARAARSTYQGRLFAEDALQGLRMIDHCREVFDVVVMNPPFGQPTEVAGDYLKSKSSDGWKDIYAGFFERAIDSKEKGRPHRGYYVIAVFSYSANETTKRKHDRKRAAISIIDLGKDVLDDAAVQTALTVLGDPRNNGMMAYADLFEIEAKDRELLRRSNLGP